MCHLRLLRILALRMGKTTAISIDEILGGVGWHTKATAVLPLRRRPIRGTLDIRSGLLRRLF
jgi:hypothetical protein